MTDLTTAIETAHAERIANQPPAPEPMTTVLADTKPIAKANTVFHAWMEDADQWDGWAMYTDLPTALQHAAVDYVSGEYPDPDDDEPDLAKPGALVWTSRTGASWCLADDDRDTGVRVTPTAVYGPASA